MGGGGGGDRMDPKLLTALLELSSFGYLVRIGTFSSASLRI